MTMSDDQEQWDKVISGKHLPDPNNKLEQKAYRARQVLLWQDAKKDNTLITPEQAREYYAHSQHIYRKRQQWYWLTLTAKGLLIIALGLAIIWAAMKFVAPQSTTHTYNLTHSHTPNGKSITFPSNHLPITDMPMMTNIPKGSFTMGCKIGWDDSLGGCRDNEYPPHMVNVESFALARHEVTVGQFKRFVKETHYITVAEEEQRGCTILGKEGGWIVSKHHNWKNPSFEQDDNHPVVCVSWIDAHAYTVWLSQVTGKNYRLPTEEEWEYAARGKKITAFYWGNKAKRNFANYLGKEGVDQWEYTAPVAQLVSNEFGLHDISGNVWEIVGSCWRENYKQSCLNENVFTRRGGGWDNLPPNIRSSYRSPSHARDRSYLYGFRVAHDL